ncbi:hypothetical protein ASC93_16595 [Massilia sp. Root335]|nr:hypothetical protein ASC93_16595 [Massilia sp. Root335]
MHGQHRAAQGPRPRSRALAWGVAAVGAVVAGGALLLFGGGEEGRTPAVAVAAAPAVTSVAEVPRAAPVTPVSMPAPAASTAAVLRDEPAAPAVPEPAAPMANPLADMAQPPAPERHKTHAAKAEPKEAHAKAAHRKAHDAARDTARDGGREKRAKPRAAREQDSDVVLLAALMSHMEPVNRKATPAQQLEACRRYNAAGEEQCRVRVCDAVGRREAACKRVPVARPGPET